MAHVESVGAQTFTMEDEIPAIDTDTMNGQEESNKDGIQQVTSPQDSSSNTNLSTDEKTDTTASTTPPPDKVKFNIISSLAIAEPRYREFVTTLANTGYPSLAVVRDFIDTPIAPQPSHHEYCLLCGAFKLRLLQLAKDSVDTVYRVDNHQHGPIDKQFQAFVEAIQKLTAEPVAQSNRLILLIEDLQPRGLTLLGSYFHIDPRVFERYLGLDREYARGPPGVIALDYVQAYQLTKVDGSALREKEYVLEALDAFNTRKGKVKRFWRDIAGHEQRVVLATIREPDATVEIDMLLFPSLPNEEDRTLSELNIRLAPCQPETMFPSLTDYLHHLSGLGDQERPRKNGQLLRDSVSLKNEQHSDSSSHVAVSAAVEYAVAKWQVLADQLQETISESNIPDYANLNLIRSIMRRRHVFTETARTLSALRKIIPPRDARAASDLGKITGQMRDWVEDLDGLLSTMSSYVALDDTDRGIRQARRGQQLTVLAFIFIPMTTVATVFGMNVNVLQENPSIAWFVLASAATTIVTFTYAAWYSQLNTAGKDTVLYVGSVALDLVILLPKCLCCIPLFAIIAVLWILVIIYTLIVWLIYIPCTFMFCNDGLFLPDAMGYGLDSISFAWNSIKFFWNIIVSILGWTSPAIEPRKYWRDWSPKKLKKAKYWVKEPEPGADCIVM